MGKRKMRFIADEAAERVVAMAILECKKEVVRGDSRRNNAYWCMKKVAEK